MLQVDTPWIGLAALAAMFAIPFLPNWLFEGPRTIRHRPQRHICAECEAAWTPGHVCEPDDLVDARPLQGQLERLTSPKALQSRSSSSPRNDNS